MPEIKIKVGGREYEVACQEGEEHFLTAAAQMLDAEASVLVEQIGHIPENRMLLMAGLMLADKTAGVDDSLKVAERKVAELQTKLAAGGVQPAQQVRVPVIPEAVTDSLAEIAARAEALAELVEDKVSLE